MDGMAIPSGHKKPSKARKPTAVVNKNKKIMVMKNENGVLKKLFLKPAEFETLKNDPKNRI